MQLKNSAEIFNFLSDLPTSLDDFEILKFDAFDSITSNFLEQERKKAIQTSLDASTFANIKHRRVKKRDPRNKQDKQGTGNVLKSFFGENRGPDDMRNKNVRQTGTSLLNNQCFMKS